MRGLFDTDGGTILHKHTVNKKDYTHFNICFSNHSKPLLVGFQEGLKQNNIKSSINKHCVMVYNAPDIKRFFDLFEPKNPKHWHRYKDWLQN